MKQMFKRECRASVEGGSRTAYRAIFVLTLCASLHMVQPASAYDLPVVNLGFTSFYDGTVPNGPGWYPQQYLQVYSAGRLTDNRGKSLGLPRQDVNVLAQVSQLAYLSDIKIGSASPGIDFVLPTVPYSSTDDGLGGTVLKAQQGVGDLLVGPFLQFDPVMGEKGPIFAARIEAQMIFPTGKYDPSAAVNAGSGFFSFDPYVAATVFLTPEFSVSGRLHYLWNARNDRPQISFGPTVLSTQAGQALHANFAAEYKLNKEFVVGLNGYWLQQITDTLANGTSLPGRRERIYALGPGGLWKVNDTNYLLFNAYYEFGAQNRPEGQRYTMRWVGFYN